MRRTFRSFTLVALLALLGSPLLASANDLSYTRALEDFRNQQATAPFFRDAVAYAIFPTVGKAGFVVGGAYGKGRVYKRGAYIGNVVMGQASIGWQFGGQAFSEIIFFQTEEALAEFTAGSFQLGADASAVALTAGAQASASTKGPTASAGMAPEETESAARWYRGLAVFTLTKGGLMVAAAVGGQMFDYEPLQPGGVPAQAATPRQPEAVPQQPATAPATERSGTIRLEPLPEEAW